MVYTIALLSFTPLHATPAPAPKIGDKPDRYNLKTNVKRSNSAEKREIDDLTFRGLRLKDKRTNERVRDKGQIVKEDGKGSEQEEKRKSGKELGSEKEGKGVRGKWQGGGAGFCWFGTTRGTSDERIKRG